MSRVIVYRILFRKKNVFSFYFIEAIEEKYINNNNEENK